MVKGSLPTFSKYGKHQLVMKNSLGDWSQSETAKYFQGFIRCIAGGWGQAVP